MYITVHEDFVPTSFEAAIRDLRARRDEYSYDLEGTRSRVTATITHRVREFSETTASILSFWLTATGEEVDYSRKEVEIAYGDRTSWFLAGRIILQDLLTKTRARETVYLYLSAIGSRGDRPVSLIVDFKPIEGNDTVMDAPTDAPRP